MNNFLPLRKLLAGEQPATVVFVNDAGFIGGAGVAHRRKIQSFLSAGHKVAAVCWLENPHPDPLPPRGGVFRGQWLGLRSVPDIHQNAGLSNSEIAQRLCDIVSSFRPDLVIFGNLHWASWTVDVVEKIAATGIPSVCYLHDSHWLTGRCAYTGECKKYLAGCDASCPTPEEYPPASPYLIESNWLARRRVFCGDDRVPLFANSHWMQHLAESAFNGKATVRLVPLGLDNKLFSPIDRTLARRLLELPTEGLLVVVGAVDLREPRKGGALLESVIKNIHKHTSARVVTFGARSEQFQGVISLGIIQDERLMPFIYSAADVMIHTAHEESFGQTLMEAAACGIPVISMAAGGMVDIARHGKNGLNVPQNDPVAYFDAVRTLLDSTALRVQMGAAGCEIVELEYSLATQYAFWKQNLMGLCDEGVA